MNDSQLDDDITETRAHSAPLDQSGLTHLVLSLIHI